MARFKKTTSIYHQVTIDEYIKDQEDLFPDGVLEPPKKRYTGPWRVKGSAIEFPGAIDAVGAPSAAPAPAQVVYSRYRKQRS